MKITRVAAVFLAAVVSSVVLTATQASAAAGTDPADPPAAATGWQAPTADLAVDADGNVTECKKKHRKPGKIDPKRVSINEGTQEVV